MTGEYNMHNNKQSVTGRCERIRPALENVPVPDSGQRFLPQMRVVDLDMTAIEVRVLENYLLRESAPMTMQHAEGTSDE